jgi:hypothetical protein
MIGNLDFNSMAEIMYKMEKGNYETVQMKVLDVCVLPNNRLLSTTLYSIAILDEKFNIVKETKYIDGNAIYSYGVAFNNEQNFIYVSSRDSIYLLDVYLNKIKSFGSRGSNKNSLIHPRGIFLKDDYLYVCDRGNKRIQILNSDLEYIDTIKLFFIPDTIKIFGTTIGIAAYNGSIQFYDLKTKEFKKELDNLYGRISEIDSLFYVVTYSPSKMFYCFDSDGNIKREIDIERFKNLKFDYWGGNILYFNNSLIMTSYKTDKIIKFI